MKERIKELAQGLSGKMIGLRQDIHQHPESGWTEFRTSSLIATALKEMGYTVFLGDQIIHKPSMMGVPKDLDHPHETGRGPGG